MSKDQNSAWAQREKGEKEPVPFEPLFPFSSASNGPRSARFEEEERQRFSSAISSFVLVLVFLFLQSGTAFAQWVTQTITLNPGWNAVYLEVQPANSDCDAVFAGMPV